MLAGLRCIKETLRELRARPSKSGYAGGLGTPNVKRPHEALAGVPASRLLGADHSQKFSLRSVCLTGERTV